MQVAALQNFFILYCILCRHGMDLTLSQITILWLTKQIKLVSDKRVTMQDCYFTLNGVQICPQKGRPQRWMLDLENFRLGVTYLKF